MSERNQRNRQRPEGGVSPARNPLMFIVIILLTGMALLSVLEDEETDPQTVADADGNATLADTLREHGRGFALDDFFGADREHRIGADFSDQDLEDTALKGNVITAANFEGADLSDMDLAGTRFGASNFEDADFSGANLRDTIFIATNLQDVDFSDACLLNASIIGSNVDDADFEDAYIVGIRTEGTDMDDADTDEAVRTGAEECPD